jgi:hypothetical protein
MRDRKKQLTVVMPAGYQPDKLVDRRTTVGSALFARLQEIETDLGGDLSYAKRSLVRRAIWLELVCESSEQLIANREPVDLGSYVQTCNALQGLLRTLGLERHQRPVKSLREIMGSSP